MVDGHLGKATWLNRDDSWEDRCPLEEELWAFPARLFDQWGVIGTTIQNKGVLGFDISPMIMTDVIGFLSSAIPC